MSRQSSALTAVIRILDILSGSMRVSDAVYKEQPEAREFAHFIEHTILHNIESAVIDTMGKLPDGVTKKGLEPGYFRGFGDEEDDEESEDQ